MDQHSNDEPDNENKVLDLTFSSQDEGGGRGEEGPSYICDHCEIPMLKAEEDLLSGKEVIVRQGQYFCTCGMIHDPEQQHQRLMKSQEKTGPVISKPSNDFFFESIPSNAGLQPKRHEGFDPEPNEREQLEADGCTVLEERITTSDGRTIMKR
jgi:hypothetical protein